MEFKIDEDLQAALTAFLLQQGPWVAVAIVFVLILPKIIPAVSSAVAEQRKISHKRQDNLRKIQNAASQRQGQPPASSQSRPKSVGTRQGR